MYDNLRIRNSKVQQIQIETIVEEETVSSSSPKSERTETSMETMMEVGTVLQSVFKPIPKA